MQKPTLRLQKENALQKLTSEFPKTNQHIIYNLISTAYQEVDELVDTHIVLLENDMEAISYYAECTILDQD